MNIKKSILLRVRIAFLLVLCFAVGIVMKIGLIQFSEGSKWAEMAKQMNFQYRTVKATRGNIYSDNGSLLATSLPSYKVAFDPTRMSDKLYASSIDSLTLLLAKHFKDNSAKGYKRKINNAREAKRQYMLLSRKKIGYQEKKMMSKWPIFREGQMKGGIIFEKLNKRFRPFSKLGQRTIGFINENNRGAGLEYSFNEQLAGKDGEAPYQKIAGGTWKPIFDGSEIETEQGWDIASTIDINLQDVSETALLRALEENEADYGTVILMEVKTGEIKAISNLTRSKKGYYYEEYNHAVAGLMEPGSTFKLATMIALLEETNINLSDSIQTGDGEYRIYNNTVRDDHHGGFGTITVQQAFELSSNIAMAKLVEEHFGLKPQRFLEYVDRFHLSKPLGFQMIGEGRPKVVRPEDRGWSGISLPWMAYGYGLEMTPLQVLAFYNAVANDGKMIRPIIVKEARKADKVKKSYETSILSQKICSKTTLKKVRTMLEGVVTRGTANNIKNAHYKIAGKTGTAQLLEKGRYTKRYITSFAGYFPADKPKYSAIVIIRNPKGARQYGSSVAAPVFKEIADNLYARDIRMHRPMPERFTAAYGVFPVIQAGKHEELKYICDELGVAHNGADTWDWVRAARNGNAVRWSSNQHEQGKVPNVVGMTLRDALYLLENAGLRVRYEGSGRVSRQSFAPGEKVVEDKRILITLS